MLQGVLQLGQGHAVHIHALAPELELDGPQDGAELVEMLPQGVGLPAQGFQVTGGGAAGGADPGQVRLQALHLLLDALQLLPGLRQGGVQGLHVLLRVAEELLPPVQMAGEGGKGAVQGVQIPQHGVRLPGEGAAVLGEGLPGGVELVQAVGGGVEPAADAAQGVQQSVQTLGELFIVLLQIVLPLGEGRDLLQLGEGGGHHQKGHAAKREGVAAYPDGVVALLPGQAQEKHRPQVADELHLGAGGLQREDVVLVEDGHGLQRVVPLGVLAGVLVGDGVDLDLHHAGLPGQVLGLGRHAVQGIVDGEGPGQVLEGLGGLALEVEVLRGVAVKGEDVPPGGGGRHPVIRQVHDLVVVAVVRQGRGAVDGVALYHAALRQVAVVVGQGVVGLVIGGLHPVVHRQRGDGGEEQGPRQQAGQHAPEGAGLLGMGHGARDFLFNRFSAAGGGRGFSRQHPATGRR